MFKLFNDLFFFLSLLTSHALLANRGLMCLYAGSSVPCMTGHNMQRITRGEEEEEDNCKVGEVAEEHVCVLGWS